MCDTTPGPIPHNIVKKTIAQVNWQSIVPNHTCHVRDVLRERQRFIQFEETDPEVELAGHKGLEQAYLCSDEFTGPEQHAHALALGRAIEQGLRGLSARSRQTFLMREQLGLENDDIAAQLGLSKSNTWVLLYRAKQALVKHYGKKVITGPFQEMRYGDNVACSAYVAKLVGSYEELHAVIEQIIQTPYKAVIDIGCA